MRKGISLTLRDLINLLRRHVKAVVVTPVVAFFIIVMLTVTVLPPAYKATATITVSDPSGTVSTANLLSVVNTIATDEIAPYTVRDSKIKVTAKNSVAPSGGAQMFEVAVKCSDEQECLGLANDLAQSVALKSAEVFQALQEEDEAGRADLGALNNADDVAGVLSGSLLQDTLGSDRTFEFCSFTVNNAVEAEPAGAGPLLLGAAAAILGLLAACAVIVFIDAVRKPIRGKDDVTYGLNVPVLSEGEGRAAAEQLWANIQFRASGTIESICLLPVGDEGTSWCARHLVDAIERTGVHARILSVEADTNEVSSSDDSSVTVFECESLDRGMGAAYCAREASATVVCAVLWRDSRPALRTVADELELAGVSVTGAALRTD